MSLGPGVRGLQAVPLVSVIIPVLNEEKFIGSCLDSLLAQDYPLSRLEILVVDGGSTDATRSILDAYCREHANVRVLENPRRIQSAGLNLGLRHARGDIVVRCDAHSTYASDYVRRAVEILTARRADNVGGTLFAVGKGYVGTAIAIALSTPFGVGDARFRFATREQWVDTVYPGAWRAETLRELGGWNEEWVVNEDYELNYRLRAKGGRILVTPSMRVHYWVRDSLRGLAKQYFRYGMWKVKTLRAHPESVRWRQLVAPMFVLSLLVLGVAGIRWPLLAAIVPGVYLATATAVSVALGSQRGWKYTPILPVVFATMHLCWGVGFWAGVLRFGLPRFSLRTFVRLARSLSTTE